MWKFLRGGATVIPGATFIPESRVLTYYSHPSNKPVWWAEFFVDYMKK